MFKFLGYFKDSRKKNHNCSSMYTSNNICLNKTL